MTTVVILLVLFSGSAFATPDRGIMRDIAIEAMLNYAKELYQRGDYKESKAVMARIKQLSPQRVQQPKESKIINVNATVTSAPLRVQVKPIEIVAVAVDPNADLRQSIASEDRILSDLNRDVDMLRTQIQATQHE